MFRVSLLDGIFSEYQVCSRLGACPFAVSHSLPFHFCNCHSGFFLDLKDVHVLGLHYNLLANKSCKMISELLLIWIPQQLKVWYPKGCDA